MLYSSYLIHSFILQCLHQHQQKHRHIATLNCHQLHPGKFPSTFRDHGDGKHMILGLNREKGGGCSEQNEGCLERESIPTSLMWASQKRVHCWETFLKRIVKYRIQGRRQTRKREDTYMGADFLSKNQKLSFFASAIYHILMTLKLHFQVLQSKLISILFWLSEMFVWLSEMHWMGS